MIPSDNKSPPQKQNLTEFKQTNQQTYIFPTRPTMTPNNPTAYTTIPDEPAASNREPQDVTNNFKPIPSAVRTNVGRIFIFFCKILVIWSKFRGILRIFGKKNCKYDLEK